MFVTLPADTPVDLYAATKIPVTSSLSLGNFTDVPVMLATGKTSPTGIYERFPLYPKADTTAPPNQGIWGISVHMDTQIFVVAGKQS